MKKKIMMRAPLLLRDCGKMERHETVSETGIMAIVIESRHLYPEKYMFFKSNENTD